MIATAMTEPTPPIELTGTAARWPGAVAVPPAVVDELRAVTAVVDDEQAVAEASRDWWPLALHWSLAGEVPQRAAAVVRPATTDEVAAVVRICAAHRVPLTVAGGRSGVTGASVPVFGGIVLDTTALAGIVAVDATSGVVEVLAGTFGPDLERELQATHGLSVGHFPQSFDIATVGGWVACRGAGQYSTRYGKIEDLVVGLEVVLADGTVVRTGGAPAAAVGPDLTQLFVGSEGTLGVVTRVWLRAHPVPAAERRAACWFDTFAAGIEACRRSLQRGATPAVLRLYDGVESARGHGGDGTRCVLLVLDEGDPLIVDATIAVVADACATAGGTEGDAALVDGWVAHRNDTSALQGLTRSGYVVDTMEIAAPWAALPTLFDRVAAPSRRSRTPSSPAATCRTATPTAPASTSRSPPHRRPRTSSRRTWRSGTPVSAPCSPAAATSRTTTASASTAPASWPTRSAAGSPCSPRSRRRSTRPASSTPASSACRARSASRRGRLDERR